VLKPASEVDDDHPESDDGKGGRSLGRILIGEPDPSLVRFGGLVVAGELTRALDLQGRIDEQLSLERRARPVKVRRRGASPAQLVLALAECQLVGGSFFSDLEEVRSDEAGARLRIVSEIPSAPAALQRAKQFRRVHCQRVERALADAGHELDRRLGRERSMELFTIDLDATQIEVYGRYKQGAARNRQGQLSYAPHIAFWAQTGRALCGELVGGNREKLTGQECARNRAPRDLALATRTPAAGTRAVVSADRLGLLPDRAPKRAARRARVLHRVGAPKPGDVEGACPDTRGGLARRAGDAKRAGGRDHLYPAGVEGRAAEADRPPRRL
jgi:hypothetical protein